MDIVLWLLFSVCLFAAYTLGWFLLAALIFMLRGYKGSSITMGQAGAFGLLSAFAHLLVYVLFTLYTEIGG